MKIGILQTGQAPEPLRADGDYPEMFMRLLNGQGFDFATWHVEGGDFPASVHDADGWLITGSRHGVYEDHGWIPPLEDFIRRSRATGVPMVGVCFGHQIMAQALGGVAEKFAGGWSIGPATYDFGGEPLTLSSWHQDQVTAPPPGARILAGNDFCRYAALGYGDWGFSVQAHPEYDGAFIGGLIEHRGRGLVPDQILNTAAALLDTPLDSPTIAERIAAHFKAAQSRAA